MPKNIFDTEAPLADGSSEAQEQTSSGELNTDDGADEAPAGMESRWPRSVHISVRYLAVAAVITILFGAASSFAWLYMGTRRQLDTLANDQSNRSHAEKIALDYAVNAATMHFRNLKPWKDALVAGTSPELNQKLSEAAKSMEQILLPLEWSSTAEPLVAKVRSDVDGTFVVDCFVSVKTKTIQAAEALQSTATYSVAIDSNSAWEITDVGGVGKVVGQK